MTGSGGAAASSAKDRARPGRWRRASRVALWAGAALVAAWFAFAAWVEQTCVYRPPALPENHASLHLPVVTGRDGVARCGESWLHRDRGIAEIFLVGDGPARGHALAALCREDMEAQEAQLFRELDRLLPGALRRYFVRKGILFAFRNLPDAIDDSYELEAAAMVPELEQGTPHALAAEFPTFHRVLFYQTLYDTGQAMAEAGIVDAEIGCTSFAASGPATASGRLLVARNCDFEAGDVFDDRKLVYFVAPDGAARYVCVSWAGMLGVVSGVNEHGLVLMLHAARTERTRWPRPGTPVPFLLRDALMNDRTIEEVAERFRRAPDHAAAIVLAAESATGRSATIETDPVRTVVVSADDGVTVCANTLRAADWRDDPVVRAGLRVGSSPVRQARMQELVAGSLGRLDAVRAGAILRDRAGLGNADVGLGNRTTVGALVAAHAVVWDAATGCLHVSRAPRGLGEFVRYDTNAFFSGARPAASSDVRAPGPATIPEADVAAAADASEGRRLVRASAENRIAGDRDRALADATEAARRLRGAPDAMLALAESLSALGRTDDSRRAAEEGLARQPMPGPERDRLRALAGSR